MLIQYPKTVLSYFLIVSTRACRGNTTSLVSNISCLNKVWKSDYSLTRSDISFLIISKVFVFHNILQLLKIKSAVSICVSKDLNKFPSKRLSFLIKSCL